MTIINYISASLEIWGCVMSAIVAFCLFLSKQPRDLCKRLYLQMLACNTGALLFDFLALMFRGNPGDLSWWGVRISNFIAFSCGYLLMVTFVHYLTEYIGQREAVSRVPLQISRVIGGISLALVVLTQFFPLIYSIDSQNIYHRENFFWLSHMTGIVGLILCVGMLVHYRRAISRQERAAFWIYVLLSVVALCVQMFVYGLVLLNLVNSISLIIVFLFLQAEQGRHIAEAEHSLTESRIAIMLSQIQPHFLFNALNTIEALCTKDPELAAKTVQDFGVYLRGNMDSLTTQTLIPFRSEYQHMQHYLSIEMLRFDNLEVIYDMEAEDFALPPLTVQPIVENAVKHGINKRRDGGTLTIATREKEECYQIIVTDNGIGFDTQQILSKERSHIGMDNVRNRLWQMCGGSLTVESQPGVGTTATIIIPKGGQPVSFEHKAIK